MKQTIQYEKNIESTKKTIVNYNKIKNGILFIFSLCVSMLFLFFALNNELPKREEKASEIVSVFKETNLYDFLDLENCENYENAKGSV